MSNLIHKVKDAVTGEHHHHRDKDDGTLSSLSPFPLTLLFTYPRKLLSRLTFPSLSFLLFSFL